MLEYRCRALRVEFLIVVKCTAMITSNPSVRFAKQHIVRLIYLVQFGWGFHYECNHILHSIP